MWTLYRLLSLIAFISVVKSQSLSSDEFEQKVFLDEQQNFQMWWNFNSTHILIQVGICRFCLSYLDSTEDEPVIALIFSARGNVSAVKSLF